MKLTIKNLQKKLPINREKIKKIISKSLPFKEMDISSQINICFVDDLSMRIINRRHLGHDFPTDVLAFDMSEECLPGNTAGRRRVVADIVVSTDTALSNSRRFRTLPEEEVNRYVIHGLLHICGYRDKNPGQRKRMRMMERKILLGIE